MKGKSIFTSDEWQAILKLIAAKIEAPTSEQKNIRNQMREIGFYITDFTDKKRFTVDDANELVDKGQIEIAPSITNETLIDSFRRIPHICSVPYPMDQPNDHINLYTGEFQLIQKSFVLNVKGRMWFQWIPDSTCQFSGSIASMNCSSAELLMNFDNWKLTVRDHNVGSTYIDFSDLEDGMYVAGKLHGLAILGDKSISFTYVEFALPNMVDLLGKTVREEEGEKLTLQYGRVELKSSKYLITLDKLIDYKRRKEALDLQGGFIFQYSGRIEKQKGPMLQDDLKNLLPCLNTFLTFINGRRTAVYLATAKHEAATIFTDVSSYLIDSYKYVQSWVPQHSHFDPQTAWEKFSTLWADPSHRHFLESIVHWYIEANAQSGFVEGAIVMAQTGLELLYNWYVIEEKKILTGDDARNISASNKIRMLLSLINKPPEIPQGLKKLLQYANSNSEIKSGPDSIVYVRNAIIHGQLDKRNKLIEIPLLVKSDILNLATWYIEVGILSILGYRGKYTNRCSGGIWSGINEMEFN